MACRSGSIGIGSGVCCYSPSDDTLSFFKSSIIPRGELGQLFYRRGMGAEWRGDRDNQGIFVIMGNGGWR